MCQRGNITCMMHERVLAFYRVTTAEGCSEKSPSVSSLGSYTQGGPKTNLEFIMFNIWHNNNDVIISPDASFNWDDITQATGINKHKNWNFSPLSLNSTEAHQKDGARRNATQIKNAADILHSINFNAPLTLHQT